MPGFRLKNVRYAVFMCLCEIIEKRRVLPLRMNDIYSIEAEGNCEYCKCGYVSLGGIMVLISDHTKRGFSV